MDNRFNFLKSHILRLVDKRIRYVHHIFVIKTYLKQNIVPRGFRIKHHSNIGPTNYYNRILHNASIKYMSHTLKFYVNQLENATNNARSLFTQFKIEFASSVELLYNNISNKTILLNSRLVDTHLKKFVRDNIDPQKVDVKSAFSQIIPKIVSSKVDISQIASYSSYNTTNHSSIENNNQFVNEEWQSTSNIINVSASPQVVGIVSNIDISLSSVNAVTDNSDLDVNVSSSSNIIAVSPADVDIDVELPASSYDNSTSNTSTEDSLVDILVGLDSSQDNNAQLLDIHEQAASSLSNIDLRKHLLCDFSVPPYEPINLSKTMPNLPDDFVALCKKGPSFIPIPKHVDWLDIQKDLDNFCNCVRFKVNNYDPKSKPKAIAPVSDIEIRPPKKSVYHKQPKCRIPAVEAFLTKVKNDIFADTSYKHVKDNLSDSERTALKWWQNNILFDKDSEICIRMQDKGTRFVVVDKKEDISKAENQIARSSFDKIDHDLTKKHISIVKKWANKWFHREKISKLWYNFIINDNAVPGKNSTLYKTHKSDIPVRLLTTGCNTPIENLCRFIESYTYPLVENLPCRIKDTSHLLEIIDEINNTALPDDAILVSFDIVNMFPSISNKQGIACVKKALNTREKKTPPTACILEALEISLKCNNSTFNNQHLVQTDGTAQGAPNSCSYADLATMDIDRKVIQSMNRRFQELHIFKKYRDDVFAIWCGDPIRIDDFLSFLNSLDTNLKFTLEVGVFFQTISECTPLQLFQFFHVTLNNCDNPSVTSHAFELHPGGIFTMWTGTLRNINNFLEMLNSIDHSIQFSVQIGKHKLRFLDLEIRLKNHHLEHTVYRKPTNSHMYLDFSSCHFTPCKKGIAKGVALRLRRICSSTQEYITQSKLFMASLVSRGHDPHAVFKEFNNILKLPRSQVRQKKKNNPPSPAMFITKYNPRAPNIRKIINNNLLILHSDPVSAHIFPTVSTVYKRCKNLKEHILRADPYNAPLKHADVIGGSQHCQKICDLCDHLLHTDSFTCLANNRIYKIRKSLSCHPDYVIYLIWCQNCKKQGVGSTDNLKKRWANYKSHNNKSVDSCCITTHFNDVCKCPEKPSTYMSIQIIDRLDNSTNLDIDQKNALLLTKEKFWIGTLITMHKGINSSHDWARKNRIGGENVTSA